MASRLESEALRQWRDEREATLRAMESIMGPLPPASRKVPLDVRILQEEETPKYLRRKVSFQTEADDPRGLCRIPAWLLIPHGLTGPAPAMLCLHQTTYAGKDQPAGLSTFKHDPPDLHYAHELSERGYVTLSPDYPMFGEACPMAMAYGYASGTMKGIWNHMCAADVLGSLPCVDSARLGVIGHSLGGHNALFLAAFDERLRVAVSSCGFTSFRGMVAADLSAWTQDRYMPRIATVCGNDPARMPFDFSDILRSLAPRPLLINAPLCDDFKVAGAKACLAAAVSAYAVFDAESNIVSEHPDAGHSFPSGTRLRFFDEIGRIFRHEKCRRHNAWPET